MGNIYDELRPIMEYRAFFTLPDGETQMGWFWHDVDGNPTTDKKKLVEKVPAIFHQSRQASTDEDFELIYQRELKKIDGAKDGKAYQMWIKKRVCEMRDFELTLKADVGKRSLEEQDLTDSFLDWLDRKEKHTDTEKTLQTNLTPYQLSQLHKALLEGKYIANIKEIDFKYWLTGQPVNGMEKIKWKKTKSEAIYLLDCICIDLNISTANNCIETFTKGLDSKNRKGKYREIDNLLKTLRPISATP